MMKLSDEKVIEEINLIREGVIKFDLKNSFEKLLKLGSYIYQGKFRVQIELIYTRFNKLKSERLLGTSKYEDLNPQENKLLHDVLILLDTMQDQDRAAKQLEILERNQENIADLKKILTQLSVETGREVIGRLGECWSEIYQFEREFRKIKNEFVWHFIEQGKLRDTFHIYSQLELEINSMFPIPPESQKTNYQKTKLPEYRGRMNELIEESFSEKHKLSSKEHEYFLLKFQKLFEKFDRPDLTLEKNRFWLPSRLYFEAREYHNCYLRFIFFFKRKEYVESYECLENMDNEKKSIEKSIKKFDFNFFDESERVVPQIQG